MKFTREQREEFIESMRAAARYQRAMSAAFPWIGERFKSTAEAFEGVADAMEKGNQLLVENGR